MVYTLNPYIMKVKTEKAVLQFGTQAQTEKAKEKLKELLIEKIDNEVPERSTVFIALSLNQFVGGSFDKEGNLRVSGIGAKSATLVVSESEISKARAAWFEVREEVLAKVSFSKKGAAIFQDAVRELKAVVVTGARPDPELPFDEPAVSEEEKPEPKKRGRKPKLVVAEAEGEELPESKNEGLSTEK